MSNSSDYVTWATAVGANVAPSPAAYAAMTIRQLGAVTGIADSISFNSALRQSSVCAAMIGKFTADYGPSNVVDDGNVATYEAQFVAALDDIIHGVVPTMPLFSGVYFGIDSGSADAIHVVTMAPPVTAYAQGNFYLVEVAAGNETTTPTFKIGSLATVGITRGDGTACQANDIRAGAYMIFADTGSGVELIGIYSRVPNNGIGPYFGDDVGTADNIQVSDLAPTISAYAKGQLFLINIAHNNQTTTPKLQVAALGQLNITRADGTACKPNDIQASAGTLFYCTGSALQLVGITTANQPSSNILYFTSSGSWTPPAGVTLVKRARVWAPGGGGSGSTGASSSGCGGGGGGYSEDVGVVVVPGTPVTITIGAPGAGGIGNNVGSAGGNITFGSGVPVTATGGLGGGTSGGTNLGGVGGSGTTAGPAFNQTGIQGGNSFAVGTLGGNANGGASPFGGANSAFGVANPAPGPGIFPGGGGSSGAVGAGGGNSNGASGAGGLCIIEF